MDKIPNPVSKNGKIPIVKIILKTAALLPYPICNNNSLTLNFSTDKTANMKITIILTNIIQIVLRNNLLRLVIFLNILIQLIEKIKNKSSLQYLKTQVFAR